MADKGRPSKFTQKLADAICERLAEGESLRSICKDEGMPNERTVRRWVYDDVGGFSPQYARARDIGLDAMADEILEISDDGTNDWMEKKDRDGESYYVANGEAMGRSRLRVDTRKWLLSKIAPKRYGDSLTLTGSEGGPLKIEVVRFSEK